jgi:predicted nucleotidyltransferase
MRASLRIKTQSIRMDPKAAVQLIAYRLFRDFGAEAVWLFGSQARGDAGPDSDMDFLAVVPFSSQSRYRRAVAARAVVSSVRVPKDIVVLTHDEWEKELKVPSSLANTVLREGIPLHDHAS